MITWVDDNETSKLYLAKMITVNSQEYSIKMTIVLIYAFLLYNQTFFNIQEVLVNLHQKLFKELNIIEFFPNGIFTSVGKYSNSVVELTTRISPIYLGQPF